MNNITPAPHRPDGNHLLGSSEKTALYGKPGHRSGNAGGAHGGPPAENQARASAEAPAGAAAEAAPAHGAYHPNGSLNLPIFRQVMNALHAHARNLEAPLQGPASLFAKAGVSTLDDLRKSLDTPICSLPGRSMDNYDMLKKAARQFSYAARFPGAPQEQLRDLANLLVQMGRVEFHQRNIDNYGKAAEQAAASVLKHQPNFNNTINSNVTDTTTFSASAGGSFGLAAAPAAQGTVSVTGAVSKTSAGVQQLDQDGDNIAAHLSIKTAKVGVNATGRDGAAGRQRWRRRACHDHRGPDR